MKMYLLVKLYMYKDGLSKEKIINAYMQIFIYFTPYDEFSLSAFWCHFSIFQFSPVKITDKFIKL